MGESSFLFLFKLLLALMKFSLSTHRAAGTLASACKIARLEIRHFVTAHKQAVRIHFSTGNFGLRPDTTNGPNVSLTFLRKNR